MNTNEALGRIVMKLGTRDEPTREALCALGDLAKVNAALVEANAHLRGCLQWALSQIAEPIHENSDYGIEYAHAQRCLALAGEE